jgi:hypothetical protein
LELRFNWCRQASQVFVAGGDSRGFDRIFHPALSFLIRDHPRLKLLACRTRSKGPAFAFECG